MTLILNALRVGYHRRAITPAIHGTFPGGSLTAISGANGCGKSTLLNTLAGMLPPVSGHLEQPLPRAQVGWLSQQAQMDAQFPVTVSDLVATGGWQRSGLLRGLSCAQRLRVSHCLEAVDMVAQRGTLLHQLSGGQLQRVRFARLLMQDPALLLLDEPFTGIDRPTTETLLCLIRRLAEQGKTVIAVLHDAQQIARLFPRELQLRADCVRWRLPIDPLESH
ncbi:metal ABC transporter ATP-binding protein [Pantoea sp. 1.19]|uniref:metal ABC transporter ATP-binding protein n=1 Tax=Pantoea sp. 1.19 TaxID=1925589 RepID=UPI001F0A1AD4|nr:ATP-binding cassette domain-containing protein [Pantoea sp. 1.19]